MADRENPTGQRAPRPLGEDEGGSSVCWAHRVCPECGRLNAAEHPVVCEACGAPFEDG